MDSHYRNIITSSSASLVTSTICKPIFKIGKKTDLTNIMEISVRHGGAYNALANEIYKELQLINSMDVKIGIVQRYENILVHLIEHILAYYELKGTFINSNDLDSPSIYFIALIRKLHNKLTKFNELTTKAIIEINKQNKTNEVTNYMKECIEIGLATTNKILTRGSGYGADFIENNYINDKDKNITDAKINNINIIDNNIYDDNLKDKMNDRNNINVEKNKSSYHKLMDYIFHTDMAGIIYKYTCIVNDRICNDTFNKMRTINLNTFETSTFDFNMSDDLKARIIYEGYSKTIKYFTSLLHIMEITERTRGTNEYIESFEIRYKKSI